MGPKVSIVIPVYNGSNYLAEAIESALAQTHKNLEVIVVNDGSSDDGATRRVAERYADRIRYFEKPNGGVASALNFGIAQMTGEYFSWLSHDDLYLPEKIEAQLNCLVASVHSNHNVIVYGNYAVFTRNPAHAVSVEVPDAGRKYFRYLLATSAEVHGCTLLIPKEAFHDLRFDKAKPTTQDYDMWFRLAGSFDFVKIDEALVLARQHPEQDSVTKRKKARAEKNVTYRDFVAQLSSRDINPDDKCLPSRIFMAMATRYAKLGLAGAAMAAAKKAIRSSNRHDRLEFGSALLGFALICCLAVPWGLMRSGVADVVKKAKAML